MQMVMLSSALAGTCWDSSRPRTSTQPRSQGATIADCPSRTLWRLAPCVVASACLGSLGKSVLPHHISHLAGRQWQVCARNAR